MMEISEEKKKALVSVLRWAGFIPLAFLSAWAVYIVARLFFIFTSGYNTDLFLENIILEGFSHFLMGGAFVYVGAMIAPKYKKNISLVMAVLGILLAGALLLAAIITQNWWAMYGVIFLVIGLGATTFYILNNEINFEEDL